jgi:hypothetical protein
MSKSQFGAPAIFGSVQVEKIVHKLRRVDFNVGETGIYHEKWLKNVLFDHPELLPINEIEPVFTPIIPVCKELHTTAGDIDILYLNERGLLTLVECKLWRNSEARREVIGQILDYAKEFSRWSYEDLQSAVKKASERNGDNLYDIARGMANDIDEAEFIDNVSRNLKRGRFLLIIVGDGIRESVENIANFLQEHSGLHFTFSLVELALFHLPEKLGGGFLAQPRVIARTVEIERAVIRLESPNIIVEQPKEQVVTHAQIGRKTKITEQEFYETLAKRDNASALLLPSFLDDCKAYGIEPDFQTASINLYWQNGLTDKPLNFATIYTNGVVDTGQVTSMLNRYGKLDLGVKFVETIKSIIDGAEIKKPDPFWWAVIRNGKRIRLSDLMPVRDQWLNIIRETINAIQQSVGL